MYLKLKLELSLFILPPDQRGQFDPDYPIAELAPVEDIGNLDKRRKELDMMPIEVYKEFMIGNIKRSQK